VWEVLQGWQQAIGAIVGFVALAMAALFNAHLNRRRDDRLQGLDGWLLARSLLAEVKTIVAQLRQLQRFCDETKVNNPLDAAKKVQSMLVPVETIYPQVGAKIGLLHDAAAQAVSLFYSSLAALRDRVTVQMPALEPSNGVNGLYNIVGGEKVAAALYQAERMIPNIIDLGAMTEAALEGISGGRVAR
jgi:hypothetical protein